MKKLQKNNKIQGVEECLMFIWNNLFQEKKTFKIKYKIKYLLYSWQFVNITHSNKLLPIQQNQLKWMIQNTTNQNHIYTYVCIYICTYVGMYIKIILK